MAHAIWYISSTGSSSNGGTSPSDAWDIQSGFNALATVIQTGDVLAILDDGTYLPTASLTFPVGSVAAEIIGADSQGNLRGSRPTISGENMLSTVTKLIVPDNSKGGFNNLILDGYGASTAPTTRQILAQASGYTTWVLRDCIICNFSGDYSVQAISYAASLVRCEAYNGAYLTEGGSASRCYFHDISHGVGASPDGCLFYNCDGYAFNNLIGDISNCTFDSCNSGETNGYGTITMNGSGTYLLNVYNCLFTRCGTAMNASDVNTRIIRAVNCMFGTGTWANEYDVYPVQTNVNGGVFLINPQYGDPGYADPDGSPRDFTPGSAVNLGVANPIKGIGDCIGAIPPASTSGGSGGVPRAVWGGDWR